MRALGVLALTVFAAAATGTAQEGASPPISRGEIATAIGSDADARAVFQLVLANMFRPKTKAYLLQGQIHPEWLPAVDLAGVVLLADADAEKLLQRCGRYWFVSGVKRSDNVVSIELALRCGGSTRTYVISQNGQEWRLGRPGMAPGDGFVPGRGCGYPERPIGCPCLRFP